MEREPNCEKGKRKGKREGKRKGNKHVEMVARRKRQRTEVRIMEKRMKD
jgi:flagellar biosynthesis/type III secretory pathway protein FliH